MSARFTVGHDVDLDLLVKIMSAFPTAKLLFFPFIHYSTGTRRVL